MLVCCLESQFLLLMKANCSHFCVTRSYVLWLWKVEALLFFLTYLQVSTRLELLTIHGGEHQGTLLHPYQIISLSVRATDAVRIMIKQTSDKEFACRCSGSNDCCVYKMILLHQSAKE